MRRRQIFASQAVPVEVVAPAPQIVCEKISQLSEPEKEATIGPTPQLTVCDICGGSFQKIWVHKRHRHGTA